MPSVHALPLPPTALLATYDGSGAYTDCYGADVERPVALAEYVETFYTGRLFKLERFVLRVSLSRPSTDAEAAALAAGTRRDFAAWHVEARTADQLLMCDLAGRTRSWFGVMPAETAGRTRLFFGSAVVPVVDRADGTSRMSATFKLLLGFHRVYSRALLGAAHARLTRV